MYRDLYSEKILNLDNKKFIPYQPLVKSLKAMALQNKFSQ